MTRQTDNVYRLDHAVTAVQKKILNAFDLLEKILNTVIYGTAKGF